MHKTRTALRSLAQRLIGNEDGVVAIEFGFVASFLILMLIGATDLGFAARHRSQMEGAVRAGIQEAMKGGTEEAVEAADVSMYMEIVLEQEHKWILGMPGFSNPAILTVTNSVRIG